MLSGEKSWRKIICTVCHTFGRFYPRLYTVWSLFRIKDCTFVYHDKSAVFSHFRTKQVKNAVNQAKMGFGAVNETAPKPIFYFRSRKIAKKSAVLFVSFSSVKTYRLRGSERI